MLFPLKMYMQHCNVESSTEISWNQSFLNSLGKGLEQSVSSLSLFNLFALVFKLNFMWAFGEMGNLFTNVTN